MNDTFLERNQHPHKLRRQDHESTSSSGDNSTKYEKASVSTASAHFPSTSALSSRSLSSSLHASGHKLSSLFRKSPAIIRRKNMSRDATTTTTTTTPLTAAPAATSNWMGGPALIPRRENGEFRRPLMMLHKRRSVSTPTMYSSLDHSTSSHMGRMLNETFGDNDNGDNTASAAAHDDHDVDDTGRGYGNTNSSTDSKQSAGEATGMPTALANCPLPPMSSLSSGPPKQSRLSAFNGLTLSPRFQKRRFQLTTQCNGEMMPSPKSTHASISSKKGFRGALATVTMALRSPYPNNRRKLDQASGHGKLDALDDTNHDAGDQRDTERDRGNRRQVGSSGFLTHEPTTYAQLVFDSNTDAVVTENRVATTQQVVAAAVATASTLSSSSSSSSSSPMHSPLHSPQLSLMSSFQSHDESKTPADESGAFTVPTITPTSATRSSHQTPPVMDLMPPLHPPPPLCDTPLPRAQDQMPQPVSICLDDESLIIDAAQGIKSVAIPSSMRSCISELSESWNQSHGELTHFTMPSLVSLHSGDAETLTTPNQQQHRNNNNNQNRASNARSRQIATTTNERYVADVDATNAVVAAVVAQLSTHSNANVSALALAMQQSQPAGNQNTLGRTALDSFIQSSLVDPAFDVNDDDGAIDDNQTGSEASLREKVRASLYEQKRHTLRAAPSLPVRQPSPFNSGSRKRIQSTRQFKQAPQSASANYDYMQPVNSTNMRPFNLSRNDAMTSTRSMMPVRSSSMDDMDMFPNDSARRMDQPPRPAFRKKSRSMADLAEYQSSMSASLTLGDSMNSMAGDSWVADVKTLLMKLASPQQERERDNATIKRDKKPSKDPLGQKLSVHKSVHASDLHKQAASRSKAQHNSNKGRSHRGHHTNKSSKTRKEDLLDAPNTASTRTNTRSGRSLRSRGSNRSTRRKSNTPEDRVSDASNRVLHESPTGSHSTRRRRAKSLPSKQQQREKARHAGRPSHDKQNVQPVSTSQNRSSNDAHVLHNDEIRVVKQRSARVLRNTKVERPLRKAASARSLSDSSNEGKNGPIARVRMKKYRPRSSRNVALSKSLHEPPRHVPNPKSADADYRRPTSTSQLGTKPMKSLSLVQSAKTDPTFLHNINRMDGVDSKSAHEGADHMGDDPKSSTRESKKSSRSTRTSSRKPPASGTKPSNRHRSQRSNKPSGLTDSPGKSSAPEGGASKHGLRELASNWYRRSKSHGNVTDCQHTEPPKSKRHSASSEPNEMPDLVDFDQSSASKTRSRSLGRSLISSILAELSPKHASKSKVRSARRNDDLDNGKSSRHDKLSSSSHHRSRNRNGAPAHKSNRTRGNQPHRNHSPNTHTSPRSTLASVGPLNSADNSSRKYRSRSASVPRPRSSMDRTSHVGLHHASPKKPSSSRTMRRERSKRSVAKNVRMADSPQSNSETLSNKRSQHSRRVSSRGPRSKAATSPLVGGLPSIDLDVGRNSDHVSDKHVEKDRASQTAPPSPSRRTRRREQDKTRSRQRGWDTSKDVGQGAM